jgi:hypothetical protein
MFKGMIEHDHAKCSLRHLVDSGAPHIDGTMIPVLGHVRVETPEIAEAMSGHLRKQATLS